MKNIQKILSLLLASALLLAIPACGSEADAPGETTSNTQISDTAATTAPEEPTPATGYTGILTYDQAYEAGYYSCMYITPDTVHLWNNAAEPNLKDPTASDGFATAYTEPLPRATFEKATAAITEEFLAKDISDYAERAEARQTSLAAPDTHIAVYRDGELCRHRDGVIERIATDAYGFLALFAELSAVRDEIVAQGDAPDTRKTIAVLRYTLRANKCLVEYYTAKEAVTWECTAPPDLNAPLSAVDEQTKSVYPRTADGLLTELGQISEYLPMRVYAVDPAEIGDGSAFEVIVCYREDGSRRIISAHTTEDGSQTLNRIRANFAAYWATPA